MATVRCFCLCVDYQNCICPDRWSGHECTNNCGPPKRNLSVLITGGRERSAVLMEATTKKTMLGSIFDRRGIFQVTRGLLTSQHLQLYEVGTQQLWSLEGSLSEISEWKVPKRCPHVDRFCSAMHVAQPVSSRKSYYPRESLPSFDALPVAHRFTPAHERYDPRSP